MYSSWVTTFQNLPCFPHRPLTSTSESEQFPCLVKWKGNSALAKNKFVRFSFVPFSWFDFCNSVTNENGRALVFGGSLVALFEVWPEVLRAETATKNSSVNIPAVIFLSWFMINLWIKFNRFKFANICCVVSLECIKCEVDNELYGWLMSLKYQEMDWNTRAFIEIQINKCTHCACHFVIEMFGFWHK